MVDAEAVAKHRLSPDHSHVAPRLKPIHFVGVLLGNRTSIVRFTHARQGLLLGAFFVAVAAFAREYDAVSLQHNFWDLAAPFAASLLLASVLFVFLSVGCVIDVRVKGGFTLDNYRRFVVGYWATAPLAWLYAIPFETLLTEIDAVRANLCLLTIVSLWRVFLFPRIVSVCFDVPYTIALFWIGLPCIIVAGLGLVRLQFDLIGVMGGLRLTDSETVVFQFREQVLQFLGFAFWATLLAWFASIFFVATRKKQPTAETLAPSSIAVTTWLIPVPMILLLAAGLYRFQPSLANAAETDRLLKRGEFQEAVEWISAKGQLAFPVAWDPLPQIRVSDNVDPSIAELVDQLELVPAPPWITRLLLDRFPEIFLRQNNFYWSIDFDELSKNGLYLDDRDTLLGWQTVFSKVERLQCLGPQDQERLEKLKQAVTITLERLLLETPATAGDSDVAP
jgi:hypothetical protein